MIEKEDATDYTPVHEDVQNEKMINHSAVRSYLYYFIMRLREGLKNIILIYCVCKQINSCYKIKTQFILYL